MAATSAAAPMDGAAAGCSQRFAAAGVAPGCSTRPATTAAVAARGLPCSTTGAGAAEDAQTGGDGAHEQRILTPTTATTSAAAPSAADGGVGRTRLPPWRVRLGLQFPSADTERRFLDFFYRHRATPQADWCVGLVQAPLRPPAAAAAVATCVHLSGSRGLCASRAGRWWW